VSDHYEQLADVLSEFAQTMLTDFPIDSILDQLVKRIVELLPITAAGVTLITPPLVPHYVVASDPLAMRFEQLQTDIGEGPCLLAYHSGSPVVEGNLRTRTRFPLFAGPAVAAGLGAVFAFPLKHGQAPLGALGLYRDSPGPLSPPATRAAKILADVAAAYLLNAQNRLALQQAADVAQSKSLHDQLTGLPNRTLLLERLTHAFLRSRRTAAVSALLFVDVDAFKTVNDQYGHATGDDLLVAFANRLASVLRPTDTLSRLHGDEFVVLCEDLHHPGAAHIIADRIEQALVEPLTLPNATITITITITASLGIAFADRDTHTPAQVLHDADAARYTAKRAGGRKHHTFRGGEQVP